MKRESKLHFWTITISVVLYSFLSLLPPPSAQVRRLAAGVCWDRTAVRRRGKETAPWPAPAPLRLSDLHTPLCLSSTPPSSPPPAQPSPRLPLRCTRGRAAAVNAASPRSGCSPSSLHKDESERRGEKERKKKRRRKQCVTCSVTIPQNSSAGHVSWAASEAVTIRILDTTRLAERALLFAVTANTSILARCT